VDEGKGDPRSDAGQQVIKLGAGQPEVPLTAAVIQRSSWSEQMAKLAKRFASEGSFEHKYSDDDPTPLFCSPEQIQCGESLDECSININKAVNGFRF